MTSVVVVNQHTNNFGDDAAGGALLHTAVAELGADQIDVFYIWHKGASAMPGAPELCDHHMLADLSGEQDMRPRLFLSLLWRIATGRTSRPDIAQLVDMCRRADHVFVSPAGSNIGIYKDWMYLLVLTFLVLGGVRPIFCQNTIGPSNSYFFNRLALFVLRRSDVFVRERRSYDYLASKRVFSYLGVDTALLLQPAPTEQKSAIAVVPTRLANWHRDHRDFSDDSFLMETLAAAVALAAADAACDVVIVPHLYGAEGEAEMLEKLAAAIEIHGVKSTVGYAETYEDYIAILAESAAIVSMRYHGLVLGALSERPCVAIAYENKMIEAAGYLGQADLAIPVADATVETIARLLSDALRTTADAREQSPIQELRAIAHGPLLAARSRQLRER